MNNIIEIIQRHSLTVRCLPYVVVNYSSYKEGDENRTYVNSKGETIYAKRSLVIQKFDLDYFINKTPEDYDKNKTPEERLQRYLKGNPSGERKLLREERIVENGGWWYVKQTSNTDSTVTFSRKYDKFFAPTLTEAIQMFLDSKC